MITGRIIHRVRQCNLPGYGTSFRPMRSHQEIGEHRLNGVSQWRRSLRTKSSNWPPVWPISVIYGPATKPKLGIRLPIAEKIMATYSLDSIVPSKLQQQFEQEGYTIACSLLNSSEVLDPV